MDITKRKADIESLIVDGAICRVSRLTGDLEVYSPDRNLAVSLNPYAPLYANADVLKQNGLFKSVKGSGWRYHPTKKDDLYMDIAIRVSYESYCTRKKVGCVIVTPDLVTLVGYNGTVSGQDNTCELPDGTTKDTVLHAEANALAKALQAGVSTKGATLYCTLQPCINCAKMIYQAGISKVIYWNSYRCTKGLDFLKQCGIVVEQMEDN